MAHVSRPHFLASMQALLGCHPALAILGPRQAGKTTLCRQFSEIYPPEQVHWLDLELPADSAKLTEPSLYLSNLSGLIVIDEVQLRPELFPILRPIIDSQRSRQKYLLLGSASRELVERSSETLAGRLAYMELTPFLGVEVSHDEQLWQRGGFPLSYLAPSEAASLLWRRQFMRSFLERDIPSFGFRVPPETLRRFWNMLAHYHGCIFNASELARSFSISAPTVERYLDILVATFVMRRLQPWHENIAKRQVKAPKVYIRDSGLLHALLAIDNREALLSHPKLGASWEGFCVEQIIASHGFPDAFFWATHGGAELDLFLPIGRQRIGIEIKFSDAPKITPSMKIAMETLSLTQLFIIVPCRANYPLAENIQVMGLRDYLDMNCTPVGKKLPSI